MFFFVLTSQSSGSPFMFETMLRSGVPPHIGQSPLPGSDADILTPCVALATTIALAIARHFTVSLVIIFFSLAAGLHPRRVLTLMPRSGCTGLRSAWPRALICHELQVVDVRAELRVDEQARRALLVADRISLV